MADQGKATVDEYRFKDEECSKCMIRKWEEIGIDNLRKNIMHQNK